MTEPPGSWASAEYAAAWADDDVLSDLLALARRITAALVADAGIDVSTVVDLGSGPGSYIEVILDVIPEATAVWVDGSEAMLEIARRELARFAGRVEFRLGDASDPVRLDLPEAELITTSRLVHHFDEATIKDLYAWAHQTLVPGGFFFNLDHFGAAPGWEQRLRSIRPAFVGERKRDLPPHRHDYPLREVSEHLAWLEEAGFEPPAVAWKTFYTALIAARRGG